LDNKATLLDNWGQTKFYSFDRLKFEQEYSGGINLNYNFQVNEIVLNSALNERFKTALSLSHNFHDFMGPILMDYELH
jgi:hypothetical protein